MGKVSADCQQTSSDISECTYQLSVDQHINSSRIGWPTYQPTCTRLILGLSSIACWLILDQYFAMSVDTIDRYSADGTCSKHDP